MRSSQNIVLVVLIAASSACTHGGRADPTAPYRSAAAAPTEAQWDALVSSARASLTADERIAPDAKIMGMRLSSAPIAAASPIPEVHLHRLVACRLQ